MVVTGSDDDSSGVENRLRPLLKKVSELVVERFVDFVEEEDLRIDLFRHGEAEASLHPL